MNTVPLIKNKRTTIPGKIPTVDQVSYGEIGINHADAYAYIRRERAGFATDVVPIGTRPWTVKTSNYTASNGDRIITDSRNGTFTITLPASPVNGDSINIADGYEWNTTGVTVGRNGKTIEYIADDLFLNVKSVSLTLTYVDVAGAGGISTTWQVHAASGVQGAQGPSGGGGGGVAGLNSQIIFNDNNVSGGSTNFVYDASSQFVGIGTTTPSNRLHVVGNTLINGDASANAFYTLSDENYKTDIKNISNPLELISKLRGVTFKWEDSNINSIGVIAQEVENVMPELVNIDNNSIKTVNYNGLIGLLIEAFNQHINQSKDL